MRIQRLRRVGAMSAATVLLAGSFAAPAGAQVNVTTQHNDIGRTGANLAETLLTAANVNVNQFGKLFERVVDDQIYGQPLYVANVDIPGRGLRNVIYVATVSDSVYAFDADDPAATAPLWHVNYLAPPNIVAVHRSEVGQACVPYEDFAGNIGIVGTPVIDPASQTIYFVARTKEFGNYVQRLHALDIRTGSERPASPVAIQASVPGTGDGSAEGVVSFNARTANQRAALLLSRGTVYVAWASHCEQGPYHGWLLGYDAQTLNQVMVYNTTPNGGKGGIWQSGQGPAADEAGNIYAATGSGSFDGDVGGLSRGMSVIKVGPNGALVDSFTPHNWELLSEADEDFSLGVMLLPGSSRLVVGGKVGVLYTLDRDSMGGFNNGGDTQIPQSFQASTAGRMNGSPVFWQGPGGPTMYLWAAADPLKAFRWTGSIFQPTAIAQGSHLAPEGMPGGMLSISANQNVAGSGVLWAYLSADGNPNNVTRPGILRAYDAGDVTRQLWNTQQNAARDSVGSFSKFSPPTVANGKVYLSTFSNRLVAYGLLSGSAGNAAPIVNAGADQSIVLPSLATLSGTVSDDGAPNPPSAVSTLWNKVSGPGAVTFANATALQTTATFSLPGSYVLQLIANDGDVSVSDELIVSVGSIGGSGIGLLAQYFNDEDGGPFFASPALVRTDATIDFQWEFNSPGPGVQADNFSVRWSGEVEPLQSGEHVFSTTADDGVRLWLNGQLLIDNWVDQAETTMASAPVVLQANTRYQIRLEFYDRTQDATARLRWSYSGRPLEVIPQTRLFPGLPANQPPVANAGPDQEITTNATILSGTATDDALPNPPGRLNYAWSKISGREDSDQPVVFSDRNALTTRVTFPDSGLYILRLTVFDGGLTSSDDVAVRVTIGSNQPPVVSAGADQIIVLPALATLTGSVSDDGQPVPPGALTTAWSQVSGAGTVTFANAAATITTATFSQAGPYVLRLTASDGDATVFDDVAMTVNAASTNGTGLSADYFNDPSSGATKLTTRVLTRTDATVNFDWSNGSPAAAVQRDNFSVRWTGRVRAPVTGNYVFSTESDDGVRLWLNGTQIINNWTDHALTTSTSVAIPLVAGSLNDIVMEFYDRTSNAIARLRWTYPGQTLVAIPQIHLFPPSLANAAPTVNAGADQTVTLPASASLAGTATDDGLPNPPASLTVTWSKVSGPGTVTFGAASALTTSASFSAAGDYVLRLTGSDGTLSTSDDVAVRVNPVPGDTGTGLLGQYYNDPASGASSFTTLSFTRVDPTVDFDWGTASPAAGVQAENFSVRWSGEVLAPVSGNYTFSTISDDGVRLWINGLLVIDNWTDHAATTNTSTLIPLVAGGRYGITMEFYDRSSSAIARLYWSYPGQAAIAIPQVRLFPASGVANQPPVVNAGGDQAITLPAPATLTGTASDDGRPNGTLSFGWSVVSGPGTVTFATPSALSTTATFATAGSYVLRLTVADGMTTSWDDVGVTVNPVGVGTGLLAQYFNDPGPASRFTTLVTTRTDATVDFDWGTNTPAVGVQADDFSVRWTGRVLAPVTGNYTFRTVSDDGVRLWVNGQLVINNWTDHGTTTNASSAIALVGGTRYDIRLEFYERTGGAVIRLQWSYSGQTNQAIPAARLFPQ